MTNDEIDALWDRVAHRYGIDQRDVDWLGLRAGWYQMAMLNAALLTPKAPILQLAAADGAGSAPPPVRDNGKPNTPHEFREDPETQMCVICGWAEQVHAGQ